jgi:predicted nucleic acid-binding protein
MAVVLDTSVVIALMRGRDADHERVRHWVEALDDDLVTSPLAVAEMDQHAAALGPDFSRGLWDDLHSGAYAVRWWADAMVETIAIARRHPQIGLTDASLVALAGRLRTDRIATLDLDHFRSLTTPDGEAFVLLPADAT